MGRVVEDRPALWPRFKNFIKSGWAFILVVCGAISGLTGYVASIDRGRHERAATIDAAISALRRDTSEDAHNRTLDSLGAAGLAEHLEPRAIQGLQNFIQGRTRVSTACVSASTRGAPLVPPRADVNHALRLIADFQTPNHSRHAYPDRMIDAFLVWWHGEPDLRVRPFALDGADLHGASLSGLSLRSASFINACLAGAHLDRTILDSARFDSAVLDGADFTQASLRSASLVGAHADGATFDRATLTDANLNRATLRRARFFAADLSCATLGNAHLDSAYFSTATAKWAFFGGAYLAGAQEWDEITDFAGAYVAGVRKLPPPLVSLAHARGAVPDSTTQARWSDARALQLESAGACASKTVRAAAHPSSTSSSARPIPASTP